MKPGSFRYLPFLRGFEAAVRCGSLREAASDLGLSPGALSLQLKKLSQATGLVLFTRDGRRLILTSEGQTFYGVVRRSLAELDRGVFGDGQGFQTPTRFSMSIPPSLGMAWLGATIIDFCRAHHITDARISSAISAYTLDWTNLDMAIVYDHPPFANLWWGHLREAQLRTVCAPGVKTYIDQRDGGNVLYGQTLLHEDDGQEWSRWSQAAGIPLDGVSNVYFPSIGQAVACALNGQGIALVSDVFVGDDLRNGHLTQLFAVTIPGSRAYYFVSRPSNAKNRLHQEMRSEIMRALQARTS